MSVIYLLKNVEVDTTSDAVRGSGGSAIINVHATGAFVFAVINLEQRLGGTSWVPLTLGSIPTDHTLTKSFKLDYFPSSMEIRAILTGTTGITLFSVSVGL